MTAGLEEKSRTLPEGSPSASVFAKNNTAREIWDSVPKLAVLKRCSAGAENALTLREKKDGQKSMLARRNARPKFHCENHPGVWGAGRPRQGSRRDRRVSLDREPALNGREGNGEAWTEAAAFFGQNRQRHFAWP
jgi:hypothetical protein